MLFLRMMSRYLFVMGYMLSQIVNDSFSGNEIVRNSYNGYETDPKTENVQLVFLLICAIAVTPSAVLQGVTAYRNNVLAKELPHDHKHGIGHKLQHLFLYLLSGLYGFAAGLCVSYAIAKLNPSRPPVLMLYGISTVIGGVFAWGFNQMHSHAIEETGGSHGVLSWKFMSAAARRIVTWPRVSLPCIGECYFIMHEFIEQLSKDPDLKDHFDDNRVIYIGVCIVLSLFGAIEANTYIAGLEAEAERRKLLGIEKQPNIFLFYACQLLAFFNVTKAKNYVDEHKALLIRMCTWFAFSALMVGVDHSIDHNTGVVQLVEDSTSVATTPFVENPEWIYLDTDILISVRTLLWVIGAIIFIPPSAVGFQMMLLDAKERWDKRGESKPSIQVEEPEHKHVGCIEAVRGFFGRKYEPDVEKALLIHDGVKAISYGAPGVSSE